MGSIQAHVLQKTVPLLLHRSPKRMERIRGIFTGCRLQSKLKVGNNLINYEQLGDGSLPVLCMPGALGFIESDFGPLLPSLNSDGKFTYILWDPPGYGKSRPPPRQFSGGANFFHKDAAAANGLMQMLGYPVYSILGWSDGANTGMIMGFKYPEAVRKLVLWGGNAFITQEDVELYKRVEDIDNWSPRMKAPMIEMYGEATFRKAWSDWTRLFLRIYEEDGGDLCKEGIKRISSPTLIIHGMKDAMVPFAHAKFLHENIKGSRLHVMPEGKHNLHIKHKDEFVPLVEAFLE